MARVIVISTLFMAAVMSTFCILLVFVADPLTVAIYGNRYAGQSLTTVVYGMASLCGAIGMPVDRALWATDHSRVSFFTGLLGLFVTITTCLLTIPAIGFVGGAIGWGTGNLTANLARWIAYQRLGIGKELHHA